MSKCMSEEELKKYINAKNNILRGNDIESASYILEKNMDYNIRGTRGGVNPLKIAIKQILNYIEETKNKGILDVTREKVKLNNKIMETIEEVNNEKLNYSENEYYLENEIKGYCIDKLKNLLEE